MSTKKKILLSIISILGILIFSMTAVVCGFAIKSFENNKPYEFAAYTVGSSGDRIHFLNVTNSDAILLESNGKFAMIDAGEDSDNPRKFDGLELDGHEKFVVDYVKKVAGNADGKVNLEFVIGTHAHSDHIGSFDTLILDKDITVKKAYLKKYDASAINKDETSKWDNQEVYDQMVNACIARNVELVQELNNDKFALGNLTLSLWNTEKKVGKTNLGENENSLGILVEKEGVRAFLSGDINNIQGDEDRIAPQIGHLELLKVGHHGYLQSTTSKWIKTLSPDMAIVPNRLSQLNLKSRLELIAEGSALFGVIDHKGIVAEFGANGFKLFENK